jgi:CRP/FNR family transcriptional regulator
MSLSQGFIMQHKCSDCRWRRQHFFCSLEDPLLNAFESLKITHAYSKGSMLFFEDQPSNGVYMLCCGRVKLTTYSKDGKAMILRIAEPGEVLGLSATVSGGNYEATAEVMDACQVNFVRKRDFLAFMAENSQAALHAIRQLSHNYHTAYAQVRSLGLSATVSDKLAGLMLDWCRQHGDREVDLYLQMPYTHEEIAEMIGTTRETVSRLLKNFRTRNLIGLHGSSLHIPDKKELENAIGVRVQL